MSDVHVLPLNDLKPHEESRQCECRPRVEKQGEGTVVVHNSWDGREILERALDELPKTGN